MSRNKRRDNVAEDYYSILRARTKQRANPGITDLEILYQMYERILGELAMNRFKWSGFPDTVNTRFVEMILLLRGLVVVFKDIKDTGKKDTPGFRPHTDAIFALRGTPSGQRNMMDDPTEYTITGPGTGQHFQGLQLKATACVPIWANYFRTTDYDIITTYARKLANVDRTIEINLRNARRTKVLTYDENSRLSIQNIAAQIDEGAATIAVTREALMNNSITALDLGVNPDSIEKLSIMRARLWSEAMGLLGINNANQDKKERLVADEVDANDDQVESMRRVNLNARQQACDLMRRMFPEELGNVSVEFYSQDAQIPAGPADTMGEDDA
ncbi:MAG TPA: hypothetical protein VN039_12835 [Nitrospira sp.]|nr:hypothetical protein [Nitrospira sp.]